MLNQEEIFALFRVSARNIGRNVTSLWDGKLFSHPQSNLKYFIFLRCEGFHDGVESLAIDTYM